MIDGEEPRKSFVIPSRSGAWSNQPYFNVTGLKPGPHRLTVINTGSDSTTSRGGFDTAAAANSAPYYGIFHFVFHRRTKILTSAFHVVTLMNGSMLGLTGGDNLSSTASLELATSSISRRAGGFQGC